MGSAYIDGSLWVGSGWAEMLKSGILLCCVMILCVYCTHVRFARACVNYGCVDFYGLFIAVCGDRCDPILRLSCVLLCLCAGADMRWHFLFFHFILLYLT